VKPQKPQQWGIIFGSPDLQEREVCRYYHVEKKGVEIYG
jgi:hypothetical protein